MKKKKKVRFHYYEDQDVYDHIKGQPHWKGGDWVRGATRAKMEKEVIPSLKKKALDVEKE